MFTSNHSASTVNKHLLSSNFIPMTWGITHIPHCITLIFNLSTLFIKRTNPPMLSYLKLKKKLLAFKNESLRSVNLWGEMTQSGPQLDSKTFPCFLCVDLLKDPVTTSCEHSYCSKCLQSPRDAEEKRVYSYPQCSTCHQTSPFIAELIQLMNFLTVDLFVKNQNNEQNLKNFLFWFFSQTFVCWPNATTSNKYNKLQ